MQKNYEPNKSNWIVTKIKNKKVYKIDNESGVPAENIRIIVCLTRNSANLFHYRGTSYLVDMKGDNKGEIVSYIRGLNF